MLQIINTHITIDQYYDFIIITKNIHLKLILKISSPALNIQNHMFYAYKTTCFMLKNIIKKSNPIM